jgi:hypothetical protein
VKSQIESRFRTLKITLFSLAVLSLFAAAPASFASTSHVVYASGNWTATLALVSENVTPHKTTIFATITETTTGTLQVTYVGNIVLSVYAGGVCTFQTGGVDTGTLGLSVMGTALVMGSGSAVCVTGGGASSTAHLSEGTGGLAGIRGSLAFEGTFTSATTGAGTYQGILHLG